MKPRSVTLGEAIGSVDLLGSRCSRFVLRLGEDLCSFVVSASLPVTRALLLYSNKKLLGAPGLTTRSKNATSNKKLLVVVVCISRESTTDLVWQDFGEGRSVLGLLGKSSLSHMWTLLEGMVM